MRRVLQWPLRGVLLFSVLHAVVWERGWEIVGAGWPLPTLLTAVAVAAGSVTPEKPAFTAVALAVGCPLPSGHVPFAPGLVPAVFVMEVVKANGASRGCSCRLDGGCVRG